MGSYFLGVIFSVIVLLVIVHNLRSGRMKERYAHWWSIISVTVLFVSIFPDYFGNLARGIGIIVPLNLGFFLSGIVLLLICLQFSVDLSRNQETNRKFAEEIAILRYKVEVLEKSSNVNES